MTKQKRSKQSSIEPHLNQELPYDHFGAELFATFYAASVRGKQLRTFSTEEWLDLVRLLYTLWQRRTDYEQALREIGAAARVATRSGGKRRAVKASRRGAGSRLGRGGGIG